MNTKFLLEIKRVVAQPLDLLSKESQQKDEKIALLVAEMQKEYQKKALNLPVKICVAFFHQLNETYQERNIKKTGIEALGIFLADYVLQTKGVKEGVLLLYPGQTSVQESLFNHVESKCFEKETKKDIFCYDELPRCQKIAFSSQKSFIQKIFGAWVKTK